MSGLSRYEQETIINYNEDDKTAGVYTHNRALRRKLEQCAEERPEECKLKRVSREGDAVDYILPKSWVKIKPTRILSEAQKAASRAAAEKARLSRASFPAGKDSDGQAAGTGKNTLESAEP